MSSNQLSRIYQQTKELKQDSFGIVTSWRQPLSKVQNLAGIIKIESMIRGMGYGFRKMKGVWPECPDPTIPYDECPEEMKVMASEPSYFIPGISKDEITSLMVEFDQDSCIYGGKDEDNKIILIKNNFQEEILGTFVPNSSKPVYSKVGKHKFAFESLNLTKILFDEQ